jgi:hypothetical protein
MELPHAVSLVPCSNTFFGTRFVVRLTDVIEGSGQVCGYLLDADLRRRYHRQDPICRVCSYFFGRPSIYLVCYS